MPVIVSYPSSSDEEEQKEAYTALSLPQLDSAPTVSTLALPLLSSFDPKSKQFTRNVPIESSLAPVIGPAFDLATTDKRLNQQEMGSAKQTLTGVIEPTSIDDVSFEAQYHTYNKYNTVNHSRLSMRIPTQIPPPPALLDDEIESDSIVSLQRAQETYFALKNKKHKKNTNNQIQKYGTNDTNGIWAPTSDADGVLGLLQATTTQQPQRTPKPKRVAPPIEMDPDVDFDRMIEKKIAHLLPARLRPGQEAMEGKSTFLDAHEYDYLGRSWTEPPRTLRPQAEGEVFLPKRCIHKWLGHTKGVQAIEFFPKYGHLILSAGMDHTVRIWDVFNERKCKRVYEGHGGAIRGINFSSDGRQFLSCSFDRFIHLWDTETGKSLHQFTNRRVPYCIKFHPEENTNFVIGDSNNMIVQFDTRSGDIVQEYNHHLQAVNSVTFVDENRRFVSTSDDKKILIWEWGIPVPIKYISEPSMQSMPTVTLHPSGDFFAGQSLNNQIHVYSARDKIKFCRNKIFRGHNNAGYACQIGFSPNGHYLISGDADGKLCFWDWKSVKLYKKLNAHERGPCIGALWHPIEASKVATCGWDGAIKLWD
ncbi:unnamed protein product [Albugo candida]|uniref:Pre-mRNA-processing factor 17 n=1 Tax=Albugo candida TaxID=65357 RepID=A0A024GEN0_9STRA|nr:unnamed protein product [Albugo candida]|eukprot:CCI44955.1 unnamed protein product [Albugo candida]